MKIYIKDLKVHTILGVFEWEKQAPREVIINITLTYDGSAAAASDALEDAVDYDSLSQRIIAHVETRPFGLIERMVTEVLDIIGQEPLIKEAVVEIDKPGAVKAARSISVWEQRVYS